MKGSLGNMRKITNLNSDWYFLKDGTKKDKTPRRANKKWEQVNLPHTWNNMDGQDGGFDFYRGACWYFKTVKVDLEGDEEAYLEFQGVSSIATVFISFINLIGHIIYVGCFYKKC